ncbi:MAG TPA: hypothetical protein PKY78_07995 [Candidatus Omnitrophota bacterium]|nr:hypothetical protein [Candidatus Omnitrophota bacterium]
MIDQKNNDNKDDISTEGLILTPEEMEMIKQLRTGKTNEKWYFKTWAIVVLILCVGPFGLIPLWFKPRTKLITKLFVSVLVIIGTIWFAKVSYNTATNLIEYYKQLALSLQ